MTKQEKEMSLEKSFLSTLKSDGINDIFKESTEIAIDSLLSEGLLRDIPIVNFVTSLTKAGYTIRERIFFEKVIRFLSPIGKYSQDDRQKYFDELDQEQLKKASQSIVIYLERIDSLDKPEMLGRVFEAYMTGEINYKSMMYFAHFIDMVFILVWQDYHTEIQKALGESFFTPCIYMDDALALEKAGFYQQKFKSEYDDDDIYSEKRYVIATKRTLELTDAGWDFIKVVFNLWPEERDDIFRHRLDVELDRN